MLADPTRAIRENSGETSLTSLTLPMAAGSATRLVVSHGVEGAARLLHEAADALLQNEGFGAAEQRQKLGWRRSFCLPLDPLKLHLASDSNPRPHD
jgi:hypothetical protein